MAKMGGIKYQGQNPKRGGLKAPGSSTTKTPPGQKTPDSIQKHNKQKPGLS